MSENISLSQICDEATEEGGWIEAPFEAIVRNAKARKGKAPSKADLVDPLDPRVKVEAAWFGGSFLDLEGSVVRFTGKGRKAKLFEGNVEVTLYEKAQFNVLGDAPARSSEPRQAREESRGQGAGGAGAEAPEKTTEPKDPKPKEDPTAFFHKGMKRISLLWLHSFQYAVETEAKMKAKLPEPLFQSLVSSIFITAKDRGLVERIPAPRALDAKGIPVAFVPPQPDPAELEAARQKAIAEAAKKAEEELRLKHEANLDEDVPF